MCRVSLHVIVDARSPAESLIASIYGASKVRLSLSNVFCDIQDFIQHAGDCRAEEEHKKHQCSSITYC